LQSGKILNGNSIFCKEADGLIWRFRLHGKISDPSLFGIIIAIVSLITMPILFYLKYRTGRELGSRSLIADSKETLVCSFLSLALLVGLGLNYFFGLWQADPIIGFVIVGYLIKEGRETLAGGEDEE